MSFWLELKENALHGFQLLDRAKTYIKEAVETFQPDRSIMSEFEIYIKLHNSMFDDIIQLGDRVRKLGELGKLKVYNYFPEDLIQ